MFIRTFGRGDSFPKYLLCFFCLFFFLFSSRFRGASFDPLFFWFGSPRSWFLVERPQRKSLLFFRRRSKCVLPLLSPLQYLTGRYSINLQMPAGMKAFLPFLRSR